jgi:hypothetical protein
MSLNFSDIIILFGESPFKKGFLGWLIFGKSTNQKIGHAFMGFKFGRLGML